MTRAILGAFLENQDRRQGGEARPDAFGGGTGSPSGSKGWPAKAAGTGVGVGAEVTSRGAGRCPFAGQQVLQ